MRPKLIFLAYIQNVISGGKLTPDKHVEHGGGRLMQWECFSSVGTELVQFDGDVNEAKFSRTKLTMAWFWVMDFYMFQWPSQCPTQHATFTQQAHAAQISLFFLPICKKKKNVFQQKNRIEHQDLLCEHIQVLLKILAYCDKVHYFP
ncbi:hypothetical protein GOODEAATRI_014105 [Goodea atripinnis]|uniref:Uncharacterized protein n=1 Tax=Goodea atripinnis TaxID=208336 RepID=A0ABV0PNF2_9TELE